jgi:hypothetical protein
MFLAIFMRQSKELPIDGIALSRTCRKARINTVFLRSPGKMTLVKRRIIVDLRSINDFMPQNQVRDHSEHLSQIVLQCCWCCCFFIQAEGKSCGFCKIINDRLNCVDNNRVKYFMAHCQTLYFWLFCKRKTDMHASSEGQLLKVNTNHPFWGWRKNWKRKELLRNILHFMFRGRCCFGRCDFWNFYEVG